MGFNNISSWSIKNPIPIVLLFIVLTVAGLSSYFKLRTNNFPDIDLLIVAVTVIGVLTVTGPAGSWLIDVRSARWSIAYRVSCLVVVSGVAMPAVVA